MVVLVTCKNEEDPMKNERARVLTSLYFDFSDAQGQLTPQSVWPNFELIRDFMVVLITRNKEEDPIENEVARVLT